VKSNSNWMTNGMETSISIMVWKTFTRITEDMFVHAMTVNFMVHCRVHSTQIVLPHSTRHLLEMKQNPLYHVVLLLIACLQTTSPSCTWMTQTQSLYLAMESHGIVIRKPNSKTHLTLASLITLPNPKTGSSQFLLLITRWKMRISLYGCELLLFPLSANFIGNWIEKVLWTQNFKKDWKSDNILWKLRTTTLSRVLMARNDSLWQHRHGWEERTHSLEHATLLLVVCVCSSVSCSFSYTESLTRVIHDSEKKKQTHLSPTQRQWTIHFLISIISWTHLSCEDREEIDGLICLEDNGIGYEISFFCEACVFTKRYQYLSDSEEELEEELRSHHCVDKNDGYIIL